MARKVVSLCVEDTNIKMLIVKGKRVKAWATMPLEPGLVKNAVILDKDRLSEKIKEFLEINDVVTKRVVVSVSGIHSVYHLLKLPRLSKTLLDEAVKREAQKIMPIPLDELYLSWQAFDVSGAETLVCLLGLPRSTIESLIDTFHRAGLSPYLIDINSLAVARAIGERNAIVVDTEPASFHIVVVTDGIPQLLGSTAFGEDAVSARRKITVIKQELDRTVRFYNSSHREDPITDDMPLYLVGELGEVTELLAQAVGYPVKAVPDLLPFPEGFDSAKYSVNLGLTFKEVKVDGLQLRLDVNVAPEVHVPKQLLRQVLSLALLILGTASVILLVMLTRGAGAETSALASDVEHARVLLERRQSTLADTNTNVAELEANLKEVKAKQDRMMQTLTYLERQQIETSQVLTEAVTLLPNDVFLTRINYRNGLTLEGVAPIWTAVSSYVDKLVTAHNFSEDMIPTASFKVTDEGKVDFSLQLK